MSNPEEFRWPAGAEPRLADPRLRSAMEHVVAHMPKRPYCTDDFKDGTYHHPVEVAFDKAHVQLNWTDSCVVLLFDVDREGAAFAWEDAGLPPPTWVVVNPANAHAHIAYVLETPVVRLREAERGPVRLLRAVTAAMSFALGADPAYGGLLTKNPLHPRWRLIATGRRYSLAELMEYLPDRLFRAARTARQRDRHADHSGFGVSRKVTLFEELRQFGYRNWAAIAAESDRGPSPTLLAAAHQMNRGIGQKPPLTEQEVHTTVRQVQRFLRKHYSPEQAAQRFHRRQRSRQQRSAAARRARRESAITDAVRLLRDQGRRVTYKAVAELVDCTPANLSTHYRHLIDGREGT